MIADHNAAKLKSLLIQLLGSYPHRINLTDWTGDSYALGLDEPHWRGIPLDTRIHTPEAGRDLLNLNSLGFLERFVAGEVELEGNLYLLSDIRTFTSLVISKTQYLLHMLTNESTLFQNRRRARVNVRSHYDMPQEIFDIYLDRTYMAYSCAMFEDPSTLVVDELVQPGSGAIDGFDSLEKAQWRKFKDAVDFIQPEPGENLLDVGCGYGGQLTVALESHPFGRVVGWTHSQNQVQVARSRLSAFDPSSWEVNTGDYREDDRVFNHVTSTGMVSHVGPRGLYPYVRNIRRRIRTHGRYVHHAIMTPHSHVPLDAEIGVAFNKKYVWPGFHWFTLGQHLKALEQNGFEVIRLVNLAPHYAKTIAAWYERMMLSRDRLTGTLGEPTFRAWQIYLAGGSQTMLNGAGHVYRVYCRAV